MSAQKQLPDLAIGAKILRLAEGLSEAGLRYIVERLQNELLLCVQNKPVLPFGESIPRRETRMLDREIDSALRE